MKKIDRLKVGQPRHGTTLKKNAGISLETSVIEELDRIAHQRGIKRSQLVNEIIQKYLNDVKI